jgi:hypothetical protein
MFPATIFRLFSAIVWFKKGKRKINRLSLFRIARRSGFNLSLLYRRISPAWQVVRVRWPAKTRGAIGFGLTFCPTFLSRKKSKEIIIEYQSAVKGLNSLAVAD